MKNRSSVQVQKAFPMNIGRSPGSRSQQVSWYGQQYPKLGRAPLILVQEGVKVTADRYIREILKPMEEAANAHFGERKWTLQQDGAPTHTANITQEWCKAHFPGF